MDPFSTLQAFQI